MMRNDDVIGGTSNNSRQILYEPSGRAQTNVSNELDKVNTDISTINTTLTEVEKVFIDADASDIHTISTAGGSWVATENCYAVCQIGSSSATYNARVTLNGITMISTTEVTSGAITYPYCGVFPVKKGQTVATSSGTSKFLIHLKPLA